MGYVNFQEGAGGGSGVDYPLRLMVRDEQERLRAELERQRVTGRDEELLNRDENAGAGREKERAQDRERDSAPADPPQSEPPAAEIPPPYLLSEDSPLILHNIPDYVIDPESAIKEIKARVYGMGGGLKDGSARLFDERGKALYPATPPTRIDAETLMLRLKAFVAQDSRTIQVMAQQHGTRGEPREFYSLLTSPDRPLLNREIKEPILRLCEERFPHTPFIGYIHRDTDDAHAHGWLSALQTNGLKLHIGREKVDGRWVDRFKQLDEDYLRFYSEMVRDPSVLEEHLAKKAEWNEKKAQVKTALSKGARPPALPFRERHLYDELGERRQRKDRREREANGEDPGPKKRAAPVARCRSNWECAELWGKTLHAGARLRDARFRRTALETAPRHEEIEVEGRHWSLHRVGEERRLLERRQDGKEETRGAEERERREAELRVLEARISEEIEARRQLLVQELEEFQISYEQHRAAWEKTVANRERAGLSEIKYPLHNARQMEEMCYISERTRDAKLRQHVREYELLDRPAERDELKREFADRWGREVMAEVAVHEHEYRLRTALREEADVRRPEPDAQARATPAGRETETRMFSRLFDEWSSGGWSNEDVQRSLQCVRDERLRYYTEVYLRAREYHAVTKETLRDYRAGMEGVAAPPTLSAEEVGRVRALLSTEGAVRDEQARDHLRAVTDFASGEGRPTDREAARLLERSLRGHDTLQRSVADDPYATRAFDDRWVARLPATVELAETRALAAGMRWTSQEKLDSARQEAVGRREALEFTRWVRDRAGLAEPSPARTPLAEKNELANHQRFVSQQLVREPRWTHEQIEHIREFAHRAPEKDREKLADTLNRTEQELARAQAERVEKLRAERIGRLNEAIARADKQYPAEVFTRLDLDQLREPRRVREESERLARQYQDAVKEQGLKPEQVRFSEGSAEDQAYRTVAGTIEKAERLRAAWVLAAADSPSIARLHIRLGVAGVEVEVTGGEGGRPISAVRLKLGDVSVDARSLDQRVDISRISPVERENVMRRKELSVEKCVLMAVKQGEQEKLLHQLRNTGGSISLKRAEEIERLRFAQQAVAAVRAGAEPSWGAIQKNIIEKSAPSDLDRNTQLVNAWGITRFSEMQSHTRTTQPFGRAAISDRNPFQPTRDTGPSRHNRPGGGGGSRGGR